jgi:hypothetical protein
LGRQVRDGRLWKPQAVKSSSLFAPANVNRRNRPLQQAAYAREAPIGQGAAMPISDRASVVTTAIFQVTAASSVPEAERRRHVEQLLRDEFAALQRDAAADRKQGDD